MTCQHEWAREALKRMGLSDEDLDAWLLDPDIMLAALQAKVMKNQ